MRRVNHGNEKEETISQRTEIDVLIIKAEMRKGLLFVDQDNDTINVFKVVWKYMSKQELQTFNGALLILVRARAGHTRARQRDGWGCQVTLANVAPSSVHSSKSIDRWNEDELTSQSSSWATKCLRSQLFHLHCLGAVSGVLSCNITRGCQCRIHMLIRQPHGLSYMWARWHKSDPSQWINQSKHFNGEFNRNEEQHE